MKYCRKFGSGNEHMLNGRNRLLVVFKNDCNVSDLQIKLFSPWTKLQLNGFLHRSEEKRDGEIRIWCVWSSFSSLTIFNNRATVSLKRLSLTTLHVTYANIWHQLLHSQLPIFYTSCHSISVSQNIGKSKPFPSHYMRIWWKLIRLNWSFVC